MGCGFPSEYALELSTMMVVSAIVSIGLLVTGAVLQQRWSRRSDCAHQLLERKSLQAQLR